MITMTEPTVTHMTVCDVISPLNVDQHPYFGWQYSQTTINNLKQTAYHIQVRDSTKVVWDSGIVIGDTQTHIVYNGAVLMPATRYQWRVQGSINNKTISWSSWQTFATGLSDADWIPAEWIGRPLSDIEQTDNQWSLFRKVVRVQQSSDIVSATCYVSAVHTFELFINTELVDRGQNFAYAGEGYYQAIDITTTIRNALCFGLGVMTHYDGAGQGRAASMAGLLVKLVIVFADGSTQEVVTDDTWRTAQAPFLAASLRNGEGDSLEVQDGQLARALEGWQLPTFNDDKWGVPLLLGVHPTQLFTHLKGILTRQTDFIIQPITSTILENGNLLVDFGKVMPLRPIVRFKSGEIGRVVTVQAGYRLDTTGHIDTSKLATQGTDMRFLYTQVQGVQVYTAQTHLGFRYLEIQGANEILRQEQVSAYVHRREWPKTTATFISDNQMLNNVFELMAHSLINGVQETFVDTPTREKGQFLVDAANISYGTMVLTGERATTIQAIREFVQSQRRYWFNGDEAGRYNAVYPNGDGKRDIPDYTELFPDWVWEYFVQSNDYALLQEIYPSLRATADYILRHVSKVEPFKGLITELSGGDGGGPYLYGIIDWPAQGRFGYDMRTVARTTVNALAVRTLVTVANIAKALGNSSDAMLFEQQAKVLKTTINAKLINQDGLYVDGLMAEGHQSVHVSQHANAYAVAFGIASPSTRTYLCKWLAAQGMRQGPMTVHWLLKALGDNGFVSELVHLLTNTEDWGWAKVLKEGGTFTPEAWKLSGDANSESHAWGAQAITDIVSYLVGIQRIPCESGQFIIKIPNVKGLSNLDASIPTDYGTFNIRWYLVGSVRKVCIDLPVNAQAKILATSDSFQRLIPDADGRFTIGSGHWEFEEGIGDE
jgi:alpha-L-rhamnosidase